MRRSWRTSVVGLLTGLALLAPGGATAAEAGAEEPPVSEATEGCLECHTMVSPAIVSDWRTSRHARVTPAQGMARDESARRISAVTVPAALKDVVVGCAECHTLLPDSHPDTFDHGDARVHTVVSPEDCAVCHPVEREQFRANLMAQAYANLVDNAVYQQLVQMANGPKRFTGHGIASEKAGPEANADSCLECHGTKVTVKGTETRDTDLAGEMEFPVLTGWPNQGVGRVNPDGSKGSCSACHARHAFSIEVARKPDTCSECHKGPDVPAYKVYKVSKHGNIYSSLGSGWDFDAVPWVAGEDFTAPTCAVCHVSKVVTPDGEAVAERTHAMSDRLAWRIFGLPYAHPHPKEADTTGIRNAAGLPLPTELTGEPVTDAVISKDEQAARDARMQGVCRSCHTSAWVAGHFEQLHDTIASTNAMTLEATKVLQAAWDEGLAKGIPQKAPIADDLIEIRWVEQWLFFGNSVRFASAMMGTDYGVFANGRWWQTKNLYDMVELLESLRARKGK